MNTRYMSIQEAKTFLVNYHLLNQEQPLPSYDDIPVVFDRLKSIQYDPLDVVGKNPDLVLQARIKNYKQDFLTKALYKDRFLIDGWDKQMNIYKTNDFSFFESVRLHRAALLKQGMKKQFNIEIDEVIEEVKDFLKTGPKFSLDIKLGYTKNATWGSKKASNAILNYLFHAGEIGIVKRRGTQKQYDVIDNLIDYDSKDLLEEEFAKEYTYRRICSLGLTWMKNSVAWSGYKLSNRKIRQTNINKLISENRVQHVRITDIDEDFYAPKDAFDIPIKVIDSVSFIAPLDNIIWDRELLLKIFDFDYKWEVYTPKDKRIWGYYVLPLLYGSNFIGRIEFEKQRGTEPLVITHLYLEDNVVISNKLVQAIKSSLQRFKKYRGAKEMKYSKKVIELLRS